MPEKHSVVPECLGPGKRDQVVGRVLSPPLPACIGTSSELKVLSPSILEKGTEPRSGINTYEWCGHF